MTLSPLVRCFIATLLLTVASPSATLAESKRQPGGQRVPLKVHIDKSTVDLEEHRLVVRLNRPAGHVELKVFGESGKIIGKGTYPFKGRPAGAPLVVTWEPSSPEPVAKIELFAFDSEDYYKGVRLVPWSFSVPHQEVLFKNDSSKIEANQEPKLSATMRTIRDAIRKHSELGKITLFIAGHTDSVGAANYNRRLSTARARAIARWFRKHGLTSPIAYLGFGESMPLVKTADETSEARNRRVDYLLSVEPPRFKKSGTPNWKQL